MAQPYSHPPVTFSYPFRCRFYAHRNARPRVKRQRLIKSTGRTAPTRDPASQATTQKQNPDESAKSHLRYHTEPIKPPPCLALFSKLSLLHKYLSLLLFQSSASGGEKKIPPNRSHSYQVNHRKESALTSPFDSVWICLFSLFLLLLYLFRSVFLSSSFIGAWFLWFRKV